MIARLLLTGLLLLFMVPSGADSSTQEHMTLNAEALPQDAVPPKLIKWQREDPWEPFNRAIFGFNEVIDKD